MLFVRGSGTVTIPCTVVCSLLGGVARSPRLFVRGSGTVTTVVCSLLGSGTVTIPCTVVCSLLGSAPRATYVLNIYVIFEFLPPPKSTETFFGKGSGRALFGKGSGESLAQG